MKIVYFVCFVMLSFFSQAQLYVSSNSYVFVNDNYVTVTQGVNLASTDSNIYLRNNGQLIQKTAVANGTNVGNGALSVYQEGSVNNFLYNYWCSPVGGVNATPGNSAFSISQLGVPNINLDTRSFAAATILPRATFDGVSFNGFLSIGSNWIWKYIQRNAYDPGGANGWIRADGTGALLPGEGFSMKGSLGSDTFTPFVGSGANNPGGAQRYDFRGKPNDGTISVPVDIAKVTLVGNPYPSSIDLHSFLQDAGNAAVINGTAYYWQQANVASHAIASYQGGYATYTILGGFISANIFTFNGDGTYGPATGGTGASKLVRFTPIGQGFMVRGTALGTVSMKNAFRIFKREGIADNSEFVRSASPRNLNATNSEFYPEIPNVAGIDYTQVRRGYAPQIRINAVVNNASVVQTALGFKDICSSGFDYSADALSSNSSVPINFYHILANTTHEYGMSLDQFDINKKYPVGLRCTDASTFKIKVFELQWGFDTNQDIYLHDKLNDSYTDIKNNNFEVTLPAGSNVKDRFEITFRNSNALNTETISVAKEFKIFQNNASGLLTITNPKTIALKSCEMFDISGKVIISKDKLGSNTSFEYNTAGLSEGIYIVKLTTESQEIIIEKVSVSNTK